LATHSLARGHLALGVAYYALQFIGTLGILGESISDAHTDVLPGVTAWSKQDIFDEEAVRNHPPPPFAFQGGALFNI
jgi:hypothetical protein